MLRAHKHERGPDPPVPGIGSRMRREDLVGAILARLKVHEQRVPINPGSPYVYGLTVLEPRPYLLPDASLVAKLDASPAIQGYLGYDDLYSLDLQLIQAILKEYTLTATKIQVKFTDAGHSEPNTVNVTLV